MYLENVMDTIKSFFFSVAGESWYLNATRDSNKNVSLSLRLANKIHCQHYTDMAEGRQSHLF